MADMGTNRSFREVKESGRFERSTVERFVAMRDAGPRRAGASVALACLFVAPPVLAGDPFEIEVYDATANAPGVPGLELHLNDWATGNRAATPPEAPLHGQFHATLEPSLALTPFWELGAYLQGAVRADDGVVDWAGGKLRSKFVTPSSWDAHWRLGLNLEVSYLPPTYDHDRWEARCVPLSPGKIGTGSSPSIRSSTNHSLAPTHRRGLRSSPH
jgi:hypothetical protein